MDRSRTIVGMGEALFDVFPEETRLGGAPLNVALHAHQLGNRGIVVSRIGQDRLGDQVLEALHRREMPDDHVQSDPDHPTGTVLVDFDAEGQPTYEIVEDVAWDYLQWDGDLDHLAGHCDAVCFGTLAQRVAQTRTNIYRFVEQARRAIRLFDVNLRQTYFDRRQISHSLDIANAVKLNLDELATIADLFALPSDSAECAAALIGRHELKWIALTRGAEGTVVYTPDGTWHEAEVPPAGDAGDAVGAGDACSAALLHGAIRRWPWPRTVALANAVASHVASQKGACPELTEELLKLAE